MSTDSADGTHGSGSGAEHEHASDADQSGGMQSPYDIGLAADEEETGPKPLDTDLESKQVAEET